MTLQVADGECVVVADEGPAGLVAAVHAEGVWTLHRICVARGTATRSGGFPSLAGARPT